MGCFQPNAGPKVPNTSGFSTSVATQPSCLPSHLELQHIKSVKAESLWGLEPLMSLPPKQLFGTLELVSKAWNPLNWSLQRLGQIILKISNNVRPNV